MVRKSKRNAQMLLDQREGLSLRKLADKYSLSRQGVRIICMKEEARFKALESFGASETDLSTRAINILRGVHISTLSELRKRIEASVFWRVPITRSFSCSSKILSEIESFAGKNGISVLPLTDFAALMILKVMGYTYQEYPRTGEVREFFAEHSDWRDILTSSMRHRTTQLKDEAISAVEDFLRTLETQTS